MESESTVVQRYLKAAAFLKTVLPDAVIETTSAGNPGGTAFNIHLTTDRKNRVVCESVAELEAFALGAEFKAKNLPQTFDPAVIFLKQLRQTLCDVAQIFDGWKAVDAAAWSDYDAEVRAAVSGLQADTERLLGILPPLSEFTENQRKIIEGFKPMVNLTINGGRFEIPKKQWIFYDDVCLLIGAPGAQIDPTMTITLHYPPGTLNDRTLIPSRPEQMVNGMVINAVRTDNA